MPTTVTLLAAGLGANHGYTIEGDSVHLHADLVIYDATAAASRDWSLQLWACDEAFSGGMIVGHPVAEIGIGSLAGFSETPSPLHATTSFHPPVGGGTFTMVLLLVAAPGEIHGYASYPRTETFLLPCLRGHVGYRLEGRRITLEVAAIENPRDESNLTGTLALELWALPQPYSGGPFNGSPLAAAVLGTLGGQSEWNPPPLDLAFKAPPDGTWHFCLMLREWTGTGYTTRDYTNFAEPVAYTAAPLAAGESPTTQAPFTAETTTKSSPDPALLTADAPAAPPAKPARRAASKKNLTSHPTPISAATPVSINKATAAELSAIKGLSKPVAAAIVAARPLKTLDALLEVKGLGPKLYEKLKPSLKL
jgi:DNA uptake protein ComE-like DNA-binding protein